MSREFVEMVFDCPLILLKGFLRGLITCKNQEVSYFFSKLEGIQAETFKENLKEWLGLESHVHLCIEKDFAEILKDALVKNYDKLKVKTVSEREIKEAFFSFDFAFFEKKAMEEFEQNLKNFMESFKDLEITYSKKEGVEPIMDDLGGGITPIMPSLKFFLNGKVRGNLFSIIKIKSVFQKNRVGEISKIMLVLN